MTITTGKKTLIAWNGTDFVEVVSGGSVTSVAATVPSFLSVSGSPITGAGTLAISYSGTALPVLNGGTGLTSPGTSGNVLTSNGSGWVSSAPSGGSLTGLTTSLTTRLGVGTNAGTGFNNVLVGTENIVTTGNGNTAVGYQAIYNATSAFQNVAIGYYSMPSAINGNANTGVGTNSLRLLTSGSYNVALGHSALNDITTGSGNIGIGMKDSSGSYAPVFTVTTQNDRVVMGSSAVTNAYVQVAWTVVSDARDKTNFASVPHGLNFVEQLNPIAYQFKTSRQDDTPTGIVRYGFKAQDILALEGENSVVIDAEDSEKLRINSDSLIPILVNAIKELSARVAALEASNG